MKKVPHLVLLLVLTFPIFNSFADELPAQNVIFITFDGVRYKDIYKPHKKFDFLSEKKGYPMAKFQNWVASQHGYFFGTQKKNDVMYVGNSSGMSFPGYLAIFSGQYEDSCRNNRCPDFTQNETMVDHLRKNVDDPKKIALFSSWEKIRLAAQMKDTKRVVQSFGNSDLENFPDPLECKQDQDCERDQQNLEKFSSITDAAKKDLPEWSARKDDYTWKLAVEYIKEYQPRFTYISLLETDEWAHKNNHENYFKKLNDYDEKLMELIKTLSSDKHKSFLENTSIVITTDHGRGENFATFNVHGIVLGNYINGSQNVWTMIVPSKTLRSQYSVLRSIEEREEGYSQLDVRPTIESLLNEKDVSIENSLVTIRPDRFGVPPETIAAK